MGALGAELELLVLSESTPFDSFTLVCPARPSASAARRAVEAATECTGPGALRRPPDAQLAPSFSSGTRSRLRSAELTGSSMPN
jgi:hypothetical protein